MFKKYDILYSREQLAGLLFRDVNLEIHALPEEAKKWHKKIWQKAKTLIVITSFIKKQLVELRIEEKKILIASDGVNLGRFVNLKLSKEELRGKIKLPLDKKIISYVGGFKTMSKGKGVEELIQAFSMILNNHPGAFLLLVGIYKEVLEEVNKIFNDFEIPKSNYKIVQYIPPSEVPFYLKASDILVMNYPNIAHYAYYMSPLKMFEYMAANRPIVTSDLPAIREVLSEDSAVFVKPDSLESLVEGIKKVLEDKELADKIAKKALKDVHNYTWGERAKKILQFINLKTS